MHKLVFYQPGWVSRLLPTISTLLSFACAVERLHAHNPLCASSAVLIFCRQIDGSKLPVKPKGVLLGVLSNINTLQTLTITDTELGGELPSQWATNGLFPQLLTMSLTRNKFEGTLPPGWSNANASGSLTTL